MHSSVLKSWFGLALLMFAGCSAPVSGDKGIEKGVELCEQRQFSAALLEFKKGLNLPLKQYTRSDVLAMMGSCYAELRQFEEALAHNDRAIRADPKNFRAYVNKGIVYRLQGDYPEAEKMYAKALELAPDYAELHASLGVLAIVQENHAAAVQHLQRSIALDRTLPVAHSNLAMAYAQMGRFDEAEQELEIAKEFGYHQSQVIQNHIDSLRIAAEKAP